MTSRKKQPKKASPKKVSATRRQSGALAPSAAGEVAPLIDRVVAILEEARSQVVHAVNTTMVLAYWHVGREIVEFVQRGERLAGYGQRVLDVLSEHLRTRIGRGYSTTNLRYFRTFYLAYRERAPKIRHIGGGESGHADPGAALEIRHKRGGVSSAPSLEGFSPVPGWSHYRALMNVDHEPARAFYEIEAERSV
jgi:hypothetical protein